MADEAAELDGAEGIRDRPTLYRRRSAMLLKVMILGGAEVGEEE